jgi:hypothetical protein
MEVSCQVHALAVLLPKEILPGTYWIPGLGLGVVAKGEVSAPVGNGIQVVQPVSSHFTDIDAVFLARGGTLHPEAS